jgi:hypothetical protein
MKIYTYNENCTLAGQVARETRDMSEEDFVGCGDLSLWGEGTEAEMIAEALKSLATRYDNRAGGAGDTFRWKCDREVLESLGGPAVRFDGETMTYLPADQFED